MDKFLLFSSLSLAIILPFFLFFFPIDPFSLRIHLSYNHPNLKWLSHYLASYISINLQKSYHLWLQMSVLFSLYTTKQQIVLVLLWSILQFLMTTIFYLPIFQISPFKAWITNELFHLIQIQLLYDFLQVSTELLTLECPHVAEVYFQLKFLILH